MCALSPQVKKTKETESDPTEWQGKVQNEIYLLMAQSIKMEVPLNPTLTGNIVGRNFEMVTEGDMMGHQTQHRVKLYDYGFMSSL